MFKKIITFLKSIFQKHPKKKSKQTLSEEELFYRDMEMGMFDDEWQGGKMGLFSFILLALGAKSPKKGELFVYCYYCKTALDSFHTICPHCGRPIVK